MRTVLIVGDRFAGFAVHEDVATVSQFLRQLRVGIELGDKTGDRTLVVQAAQGVGLADWKALRNQAELAGLSGRLHFRYRPTLLAGSTEVHKRADDNTLIADLNRADTDLFTATLRLHNDNELLLDHQTGQHVQGMVAVEAARQMFLAVSERYYASHHLDTKYYYVIESMHTEFENFLFPLDATIEFRTVRAAVDDPARLAFTAEISILQSERRASRTTVVYSGFDAGVIELKEHRRAARAVEHELRVPDLAKAV